MIHVTEDMRRDFIAHHGRECELALFRADAAARSGTVRERFTMMALHKSDAAIYSAAAFTWAKREVVS
ncbi:hypothetical protein [Xanthomonas sp. NCPPB 2632]|uniref:hypothetical protein n=1 Tax=Xanthomonas sp. NCPPB 2632 TaxID=3240912 RepID=UPI003512B936